MWWSTPTGSKGSFRLKIRFDCIGIKKLFTNYVTNQNWPDWPTEMGPCLARPASGNGPITFPEQQETCNWRKSTNILDSSRITNDYINQSKFVVKKNNKAFHVVFGETPWFLSSSIGKVSSSSFVDLHWSISLADTSSSCSLNRSTTFL